MADPHRPGSNSPTLDLRVVNGTVVRPDGRHALDLGIRNGVIVTLGTRGTLPAAAQTVDAAGCLVLPGLIDTHFHCRAPEGAEREDFDSGTAAAAAGGITTLFEMPISDPPCSSPEVLESRMALAARHCRIDVGLYGAPGDLDRPRLQEMADAGAVAFKIMMHSAPPDREESFRGLSLTDDDDIYRALELVHETGLVCAIHAEDQSLIDLFESRLKGAGARSPLHHARSRPPVAEALAIARIGAMNEQIGARTHIVHVSSALALEYIRWFQGRGQAMTAETTPAYLLADERDIERHGPFVKINPPLRTLEDCSALWRALDDGVLSLLVSDHAPFLEGEKEAGWEDVWSVGAGIPGVELTGRLLWHEALAGRTTFERIVAWCSENPAKLFGLFPGKGALRVGSDADLVVFDPQREFVVSQGALFSRSRGSIRHVLGRKLRGDIRSVWSRGRNVFQDGRVTAKPGSGRIVRPSRSAPGPEESRPAAITKRRTR
jgi:allantoinase